jgi:hypothetical protein
MATLAKGIVLPVATCTPRALHTEDALKGMKTRYLEKLLILWATLYIGAGMGLGHRNTLHSRCITRRWTIQKKRLAWLIGVGRFPPSLTRSAMPRKSFKRYFPSPL